MSLENPYLYSDLTMFSIVASEGELIIGQFLSAFEE